MFKSIGEEVWAFDCEWIPDPDSGRLLYGLDKAMSDRAVIEEMWRQGGATDEDPMPYLKTVVGRVVSISAVVRKQTDEGVSIRLHSLPTELDPATQNEADVVGRFLNAIGEKKPQLVGYNSRSADLKILIQRAIVKGIQASEFCRRPDKPWEGPDYFARAGDWHVDLKEVVSGWGRATPSLNELATLSGIPGKMEVTGQDVASMWLDGDLAGIVRYNEFDALTTYLVWLRVATFAGFFTLEDYAAEQDAVRELIRELSGSSRYVHLLTYLAEWDRLHSKIGAVQSTVG